MIGRSFLASLVLLCACSSDRAVPIAEVLNHRNCQSVSAGVTSVTFDQIAAIRGSKLIGMTDDYEPEQSDLELVVISKGPQPTLGYAFQLTSVRSLGTTLVVELDWLEPPTDAVLAQVTTHPCLVVGIEAVDYATLTVSDQYGVLGTIDL